MYPKQRATLIFIVSVAASWCGCAKPELYEPSPPTVTVATPIIQTVTEYLEETGTTEAVEMVKVRARVRGFLEQQAFESGTDVNKGDVLYVIQQREFKAKVDAAKAEVEAEKAQRDKAKIERDRQLRIQKTNPGATSDVAVVSAVSAYNAAEANVLAASATLDQRDLDLDYTTVKSPIDGRVGKTLVKKGNLVGDTEATHLTTVIKYDPIYVNFNISERALLELSERAPKKDQGEVDEKKIELFLRRAIDTGFPFRGRIDYADLAVDQSTGTFLVRGIFPNPERKIVPGLFVRVRLPLGLIENAILLPERAVGADQSGRYVMVVNSDNVVERRDVDVGTKHGNMLAIAKGLTGDERVIIDGVQRARPGATVTPQEIQLQKIEEEEGPTEAAFEPPIEDPPAQPSPKEETGVPDDAQEPVAGEKAPEKTDAADKRPPDDKT